MQKRSIGEILLGYERDPEYGARLATRTLTGDVSRSRGRLARSVIRAAEAVLNTFSYSSTRGYGFFLLAFGLFSFLLHVIGNYTGGAQIPLYVIISSVVLSVIGIPLVCFDKPIATALQEFTFTDELFFEFFCIKRMHRIDVAATRTFEGRSERARVIRPFVWLVLGLMLAAFTMLVPMKWILLGLGGLLYLFLTFVSPEFSFLAIIIAMPYLPMLAYSDYVLAGAVLVTLLSFLVKVALGKRVYYFDRYDLLIGIFLLLVLISGIFVKGVESFTASLMMILLAMGYVLASSLVSNRRLADCVINALIISSVPVSVHAVILGVQTVVRDGYRGFGGVSASFDTPSALAVYLLVASVFSLYYVRARRRTVTRIAYVFVFALSFTALLATASVWAFVAGLFGVAAYCASGMRRGGPLLTGVLSLAPYALLFVGDGALRALDGLPVLSAMGFSELSARWSAAFAMLRDNLLVGIGIGSDSFLRELENYSSSEFADSGNFLLEIGCEAGVLALAIFVLIIIMRVVHRIAYRRYVAGSAVHHLTSFSSVAMTVLLVYGAVNYLWSDHTLTYLYWIIFGVGSAVLRVSKREHDDRIAYFSDGRSSDSSSLDIELH